MRYFGDVGQFFSCDFLRGSMLAYLVIREGSKWSDVIRLVPGRTVTIGRAPTNNIVVKDEQCSRRHAEIFHTQGAWTLRDLDSRNGTAIGASRVRGDHPLSPGDVIRIAHAQLAFVHDISKVLSGGKERLDDEESKTQVIADDTVTTRAPHDSNVLLAHETTTITHRAGQTKFLERDAAVSYAPKVGRAAATLCRLAFELAHQSDPQAVAVTALEGIFEGTSVDAGAVLLAPVEAEHPIAAGDLQVIAARSDSHPSYHRVPDVLASTVLREGEAVLARNIEGDSSLGTRDSKGEILSTSVICAPIRQSGLTVGLIHLYSTSAERVPDADDLEFTLAVAENVALALKTLDLQLSLAEDLSQSQSELMQLRSRLGVESEIIGSSGAMLKVHEEIARAAPSRATVLIRGESGVGKELVARAVHYSSPRKKEPFVCLNCAALTETLLESELFGHERGAFTGATERKVGKFEAADGGTLMLDEIGEMGPSIQAKFLRVLEGHPFERVGGNQQIKVDVRVIAATNRDLEKAVSEKQFRRDLYFRLNVVEIYVSPLRKRPEDISELAKYFLGRYNAETGRKIQGFTSAAMRQLTGYRWPGNIRELKNVIERAVLLAATDRIDLEDLNLTNLSTASESSMAAPPRVWQPESLVDVERRHIAETLKATGWNKSRTASILGIERSTLDRKIRRYEIERKT